MLLLSKGKGMTYAGSLDRTLRLGLGAVLVAVPFLPPLSGVPVGWDAWKFAVAAVGIVMSGTALFSVCPVCTTFRHPGPPGRQAMSRGSTVDSCRSTARRPGLPDGRRLRGV